MSSSANKEGFELFSFLRENLSTLVTLGGLLVILASYGLRIEALYNDVHAQSEEIDEIETTYEKILEKLAIIETKQDASKEDITEMKQDIKEIKQGK